MNQTLRIDQRWFWAGSGLLLLLLLFSLVGEVNLSLFRAGNSLSLYTGEWIWSNITLFGDTLLVFVLLLPFIGRRPEVIWIVFLNAVVVTLLVNTGKEFIISPRPPGLLSHDGLQLIGFVATTSSFPSGHTAAAFALAATLVLLPWPMHWKVVAVIAASLVGLSRVVVGIHWPMDVFAGALTGWLGAATGCWLAQRLGFGLTLLAQRIQAILLLLCVVVTVVFHDGGYPQGRWLLMVLPLLLLALSLPQIGRLFFSQNRTGNE